MRIKLSAFNDELANVRSKEKKFGAEINCIVPWEDWITLIQPYYYKGEWGNKPYDLELMLRIYLLQNLYNLSDMGTVAEVIATSEVYASEKACRNGIASA